MEIREKSFAGRDLVVAYTCERCRCMAFMHYDEAMKGDTYGLLIHAKIPKEWKEVGNMLLCRKCAEDFLRFMSPKQEKEQGNDERKDAVAGSDTPDA